MSLVSSLRLTFALIALSGCAAETSADDGGASDETSSDVVAAPAAPRTVSAFDGSKGELPEGLAIKDGVAYVGFAPTGTIEKIDLASGKRTSFAQLPHPVPNKGFMTGLAFDRAGTLYAALVSFTPEVKAGIYAVPARGGDAKLFASHAEMSFPNGIAFANDGAMLVTDSGRGAVFRIAKSGSATIWAEGPELRGQQDYCGAGVGAGFDIGANGIAVRGNDVIVANNDKASLLAIPVGKDGRAGATKVLAQDCNWLGGADGIAVDRNDDIVVATNRLGRVVRVSQKGAIHTVTEGLDFPASVTRANDRLYVTSFALANASSGKPAHPALVSVR